MRKKNTKLNQEMDNNQAKEPQTVYFAQQNSNPNSSDEYMTLEEFRIEAKKRAKQFLLSYGIHK